MKESLAMHVPFLYTLYTRGGPFTAFNIYIYGGPGFLIFYSYFSGLFVLERTDVLVLLVSFFSFLLIYEVGYMVNDHCGKYETKPTVRTNHQYRLDQIVLFSLVRLLLIPLIMVFAVKIFEINSSYLLGYSGMLVSVLILYILHSLLLFIEIKLRIITYTLLKIIIWVVPVFYIWSHLSPNELFNFIFLFFGTITFYVYVHAASKGMVSDVLLKKMPYDFELKIFLFLVPFLLLGLVLMGYDHINFIFYLTSYFILCILVRYFGRFCKTLIGRV